MTRHKHRRPMGMPDPSLVIAVLVAGLLVFGLVAGVRALITPQTQVAAAKTGSKVARGASTPQQISPTISTEQAPTSAPTQAETIQPLVSGWKALPVVPVMGAGAQKIYAQGQALGNNPRAFSKIGACESVATWFLEDYDKTTGYYSLGEYAGLKATIDYFAGSFGRTSLAARDGARVSTLLSPLWGDRAFCEINETPLDCEYRVQKPAFAFISIGTNDVEEKGIFEKELRQVIDITIKHGVVPILGTKADNAEGDNSNNATMAKLAAEYDIPLWNFWAAVQDLPNGGLDSDMAHLSWGDNYFDRPGALQTGWSMRNLTALQVLEAMMKGTQPVPAK